jgi:hypothetical protein
MWPKCPLYVQYVEAVEDSTECRSIWQPEWFEEWNFEVCTERVSVSVSRDSLESACLEIQSESKVLAISLRERSWQIREDALQQCKVFSYPAAWTFSLATRRSSAGVRSFSLTRCVNALGSFLVSIQQLDVTLNTYCAVCGIGKEQTWDG